MLRKFWILATLLAVASLGATAQADVFVSGTVQMNPNSGTTNPNGNDTVRQITSFGGYSYTNKVGGDATSGGVRVVGVINNLGSILNGLGSGDANTQSNITAVFALNGQFAGDLNTGNLGANFDPSVGGSGQIRFYNNDTGIISVDPSTWVTNILNLDEGLIGVFDLIARPTDFENGEQGFPVVSDVISLTEALVNTARAVQGTTGPEGDATALFQLNTSFDLDLNSSLAPLFEYLGISPDGGVEDPARGALLVDLDELGSPDGALAGPYLDLFDDIFNTLLPSVGGGFLGGDTYDPTKPFVTGDTSQSISGGDAYPGSMVSAEVPEPASLIVWSVMAAGGAGLGMIRRRRNQA